VKASQVAKSKTEYVCNECGASSPKWLGQCPDCQAWNSYVEFRPSKAVSPVRAGYAGAQSAKVTNLADVSQADEQRWASGIGELDRVLGGGLVIGSIVLVGGDPGIGKSTLMLQVLAELNQQVSTLYVSGEESLAQLAGRALRLGVPLQGFRALAETNVDRILDACQREQPRVLVIDSIQTLYLDSLDSAPGSVSQVRESAARLTRFAKETATSVFLVGHVTKEGGIAGPRVLEHMVDAVLYFEGEAGSRFRVLRALKNRFGAINELGVFAMADKGLKEVSNPSAMFLSGRPEHASGSVVMVTREGTRPLLVEVQALVDRSPLANPRRVAVGFEQNRLALLLAVLHRHGGIAVSDQDVFVNVVGGIRVSETAADLPVILSVLSSFRDRPVADRLVAFGEVGLSGEIRPVPNGEERLREAASHGFTRAVIPRANLPKKPPPELDIRPVSRLDEALEACSE